MNTLNDTPSGERLHIGFFGVRNAGKSSVVNAVTNQDLALVSSVRGTTTDPVKKAMELLPLGPVVVIDTPGIDDEGALGKMRVERTREVLKETDIAVLVADGTEGLHRADRELLELFKTRKIPFLVVFNKVDLIAAYDRMELLHTPEGVPEENILLCSAKTGEGINEIREALGKLSKSASKEKLILGDLVNQGDVIVLVIPIDESAPKGRIILPQQMVLREILDCQATAVCAQASDLLKTLGSLKEPPRMVITDSQAFKTVLRDVPDSIDTTSFSILMSRYKGNLETQVRGARALKNLTADDTVLISEGCTHHRQCQDIGTVKLPNWIEEYCGARPNFEFTSGGEFPKDLSKYSAIVHCGGCMLNEKAMQSRIAQAVEQNVPITNYGIAIGEFQGSLSRVLRPLKEDHYV